MAAVGRGRESQRGRLRGRWRMSKAACTDQGGVRRCLKLFVSYKLTDLSEPSVGGQEGQLICPTKTDFVDYLCCVWILNWCMCVCVLLLQMVELPLRHPQLFRTIGVKVLTSLYSFPHIKPSIPFFLNPRFCKYFYWLVCPYTMAVSVLHMFVPHQDVIF